MKQTLNKQVITLEEAETQIRIILRDNFLITDKPHLDIKIRKVINNALKTITVSGLKTASMLSLWNFYLRQYQIYRQNRERLIVFFSIKALKGEKSIYTIKQAQKQLTLRGLEKQIPLKGAGFGVPTNKYSEEYFNTEVKPVYKRLTELYPIDPGDVSGKNSLRNRAEMEVRYSDHLQQIDDLKNKGVKLVIASTHADCSERCSPWQGRVYSLDNSYGTTSDGRRYVPLENATDVYYTTKKGKTYKNGLLGFNCRHYLVEYKKGFEFAEPDKEEERKEYAITKTQRAMEREVRKWRDLAVQYKDTSFYKTAYLKAVNANRAYIKYSHEHGRAYYPSRTKVLEV